MPQDSIEINSIAGLTSSKTQDYDGSAYPKSGSLSSSISIDEEALIENNAGKPKEEEEEEEEEESKKLTFKQRMALYWFYLRPVVFMLIINAGIPLALYYILKIWLSPLVALIISGVPPLLHIFYVFWKQRRVDVLGCVFVAGFIISAVVSAISGDARLTLLRDSAVTAVVSVLFIVTLVPLRTKWFTVRPIIFLFTQQMYVNRPPVEWKDKEGNNQSLIRSEWIWQNSAFYRKFCYIICGAWGVLLMAEFVIKVIMIKSSLTIDQIILYSNIVVIVVVVGMTSVTVGLSGFVGRRVAKDTEAWAKENVLDGKVPK